jgi:hypothetical protein
MKTKPEQKVAITLELSEYGCGQVFIHADNCEQAADAHRFLTEVTRELDALNQACKAAVVAK